ncbi:MAG TPA: class I SAM-dependent methyltransferase [Acidimicrobiales bacterium]|nr:class I SAM-dependent methyltransferase [Acidimicrobiales bacterium]
MNQLHLEFLASPGWAQYLEEQLGPWLARVPELSGDVLEVGPGPGLTTDLLRRRAATVTAVEVDEQLGVALSRRLAGTNVDVVVADATDTGLPDGRFSAATSFTMLHHMPAPESQDRLFAEVCRLLRPGGVFLGTDSLDSEAMRQAHVDDVFVPVDPDAFPERLSAAGFGHVDVGLTDLGIRFEARR